MDKKNSHCGHTLFSLELLSTEDTFPGKLADDVFWALSRVSNTLLLKTDVDVKFCDLVELRFYEPFAMMGQ